MRFKLIKTSRFLTILRPATIVLIFLPLIIGHKHFKPLIITAWELFCLGSYLLQKFVFKRYKIVGCIELTSDSIKIENQEIRRIIPFSNTSHVSIYYSSYKNQPTKGTLSPYFNLSFEEGIGEILIQEDEHKMKLFYLSENKEDYGRLEKLVNGFREDGISINLST
jgi:hypothetical protein